MTIFVFGHQNPDTDATASAIAYSHLANQSQNLNTKPVLLGEINEETVFMLDYFKVEKPLIVKNASDHNVKQVILTDHNEFQQSISDIENLEILQVIDHHRVDNFKTANPLFMRLEPIGSASSIVFKMFQESNLTPSRELAGLMLSGLISDTLLLKSPTTTEQDKILAPKLAELANVDLEVYGMQMLKAGTNLASKSVVELINIDAKTFPLNGENVRVAQVNTVDINEVMQRQAEIEQEMQNEINKNAYSDFVLMITDIVNSNSQIVHLGKNATKVEKAFNFKLTNNNAFLAGAVSRKKQIVPQLTESFK